MQKKSKKRGGNNKKNKKGTGEKTIQFIDESVKMADLSYTKAQIEMVTEEL